MPTTWETFPIKFEGGWITSLGRLEQGIQAPGSASTLQNFEVSIDGGYRRISGYAKYSTTAVPGSGDVIGVVSASLTKAIAVRGGEFYTSAGTTWTLRATGADTTAVRIKHDRYNFTGTEFIVIVDGKNDPAYYSSADDTITIDTAAPADVTGASHVRVFKNHLFFAKNNILTFTEPFDDRGYDAGDGAGSINVGSEITGLIVFREQLIVFSTDRIQRITGDTSEDFVLFPIADNTGCLCPHTIQEVGGDIMYLGPDGVRFLSATERNNDFGMNRASAKIQNDITRIVNTNCGYASVTLSSKSQYRLFTFLDSVPRRSSEGFIATKLSDQTVEDISWSKTVGIKVKSIDGQQYRDRQVILFSSDTDFVYTMESGNSFDGEDIPAIFETPYMPITDPRLRKTIYKHSLYANAGGVFSLQVNLRFDYNTSGVIQPPGFTVQNTDAVGAVFGSATSIFGTSIFSTPIDELYLNNTIGSGFTVALRYEETSINPSFTLDYAVLEYAQNERR